LKTTNIETDDPRLHLAKGPYPHFVKDCHLHFIKGLYPPSSRTFARSAPVGRGHVMRKKEPTTYSAIITVYSF